MSSNLPPKSIDVSGARLFIEWNDGAAKEYPARLLRQMCQCAHCISEDTRRVLLDRERVPQDITLKHAEPVGNYAITFRFSDGHSTGIYTFDFLRGLE